MSLHKVISSEETPSNGDWKKHIKNKQSRTRTIHTDINLQTTYTFLL